MPAGAERDCGSRAISSAPCSRWHPTATTFIEADLHLPAQSFSESNFAKGQRVRRDRDLIGHLHQKLDLVVGVWVLGTLGLRRCDENLYTDDEVQFLMQVANQIAIAVENALAFGEIRALKDKLALEKLYLEDEIRSDGSSRRSSARAAALRRVLQADRDRGADRCHGADPAARPAPARSWSRARSTTRAAAPRRHVRQAQLRRDPRRACSRASSSVTSAARSPARSRTQVGRFELADRGTVFLDEIGEIPLELQPKLLRVLQEQRVRAARRHAHASRRRPRLIAATNRDLARDGRRAASSAQDLFYRLNVFPIDAAAAARAARRHPAARRATSPSSSRGA